MTHRLLHHAFLDTACGIVTRGAPVTFTIAGVVDCPACLDALKDGPLFAPRPKVPHWLTPPAREELP